MGDRYPAEIHIGGPVPQTTVHDLIEAILAERASLEDYGCPPASQQQLTESLQAGTVLTLFDDQASGGQFEGLEAFLAGHGIHFERHSDAYCEFDAENIHYRGTGKPLVMLADQAGNDVVRCQEILEILDSPADGTTKLAAVRSLAAPPQATPLTPIQLTG